jgi:hypothetical protein
MNSSRHWSTGQAAHSLSRYRGRASAANAPLRYSIRDFFLAVACLAVGCASLPTIRWAPYGTLALCMAGIMAAYGALRGQIPQGWGRFLVVPLLLLLCHWALFWLVAASGCNRPGY